MQPRFASAFLGQDIEANDGEEELLPLKHALDVIGLCACALIAMRLVWTWHSLGATEACSNY